MYVNTNASANACTHARRHACMDGCFDAGMLVCQYVDMSVWLDGWLAVLLHDS